MNETYITYNVEVKESGQSKLYDGGFKTLTGAISVRKLAEKTFPNKTFHIECVITNKFQVL